MRTSIAPFARGIAVLASLALFATAASAQAAASICKDGTPSAAAGRGACAGHGGVDAAATKAAKRAAKADARAAKKTAAAAATVTCSDGTEGKAGRGACSRHGGIAGSASASTKASVPTPRPAPAPTATARASTRSRASSAPAAPSSGGREDNNPTGAIAQCNDGMYSHSSNRRGACSRHGGVKAWTNG